MENQPTQESLKTDEQIREKGINLFFKLGGIMGGYYKVDSTQFYKIDTMKFHGGSYYASGLKLNIGDDSGCMLDIKDSVIYNVDTAVCIDKAEFDQADAFILKMFSESYEKITSRSYLFKFEDAEGRKYEQIIPLINSAKSQKFPVHFYYAPNPSCFRVVKILPGDIETESTPDGSTKVKSFGYTENQMTIEGNPFSSDDRSMRLYKFRKCELKSTDNSIPFDMDSLYIISEWHYNQILDIIMS